MQRITPYLYFDGNCREAMNFYKDCLGGDLHVQAVGDTPAAEHMPPDARDKVMHAALNGGDFVIMASDWMSKAPFSPSNTVSLALSCTSEEEIMSLFAKLSEDGKVIHPLADQYWGAIFGAVVDRFGIDWMLNFDKNTKK